LRIDLSPQLKDRNEGKNRYADDTCSAPPWKSKAVGLEAEGFAREQAGENRPLIR
jgi:hypothetical protein